MIKALLVCVGVALGTARYERSNVSEKLPLIPDQDPKTEDFYDLRPLAVIREDEIAASLRQHTYTRLKRSANSKL